MDTSVRDWFAARGAIVAQPPSLHGALVFEPTIRLFGQPRLLDCRLGAYSYVAPQTTMNRAAVGRYCSIGDRVTIGPTQHPSGWLTTSPIAYKDVFGSGRRPPLTHDELTGVRIGHDVWIGATAAIMGGVTIGTGAIVAFGSVVTKDVAPYTIVGGVPARPIRRRFDEKTIAALLASRWWQYDLVRHDGAPIAFDDPLAALADIDRRAAAGEIAPIPPTLHRIRAGDNGRLSFDRLASTDEDATLTS